MKEKEREGEGAIREREEEMDECVRGRERGSPRGRTRERADDDR